MEQQYETISKFDRAYGLLLGGNNLHTKPSTIKELNFKDESETFIVQVVRVEQRRKVIEGLDEKIVVTVGDVVVLEYLDKDGHQRVILPTKVVDTIQRGREALARRARSNVSKAAMKARMAAGYKPTLPSRKK